MSDEERMRSGEVTTMFLLMAVSGDARLRGSELMSTVIGLQSKCIAALLDDETGIARQSVKEKLENLSAHYREFDVGDHPWEV